MFNVCRSMKSPDECRVMSVSATHGKDLGKDLLSKQLVLYDGRKKRDPMYISIHNSLIW